MNTLFILILLISFEPQPTNGTWATLSMVTFQKKYDTNLGYEVAQPNFSPIVMSIDGKAIEVEGYFIPLNGKKEQNHFMLSKLPQATCYFCGKAGPETAMQVFLANSKKQVYSDDKIRVKGTLRINKTDPNALLYTLENAVVISN